MFEGVNGIMDRFLIKKIDIIFYQPLLFGNLQKKEININFNLKFCLKHIIILDE